MPTMPSSSPPVQVAVGVAPTACAEAVRLKDHIEWFESYRTTAPFECPVLPMGRVHIVFQCGSDVAHLTTAAGRWESRPDAFVAGPFDHGYGLRAQRPAEVFVAILRPGGATDVLRQSMADWRNRLVSVEELWGRVGTDLAARIRQADSDLERRDILEAFLARRADASRTPSWVSAVTTIGRPWETDTVGGMARRVGMSVSHFRRRFTEEVGLSPKLFIRLARLHAATRFKLANPEATLTRVSSRFYYDQPHFVRDFKAITGMTPGAFFTR